MTDLEAIEQHLADDLEQRRGGGEDCPECFGNGFVEFVNDGAYGKDPCPDCKGSGKSPAITQAEEALAAVRRVRAGVEKVRQLFSADSPEDLLTPYGSGFQTALRGALDFIDTTKPVTDSTSETVTATGSEG
jgi:hypothetical protein